MDRPVLLAVTAAPCWPTTDGTAVRIYHLLRELAAAWRVVLVAPPGACALPAALTGALDDYVPVPLEGRWRTMPSQFDPRPLRAAVGTVITTRQPAAALVWGAEFLAFERGFPPTVGDRIDCLTLLSWRNRHLARTPREWLSAVRTVAAYATYERRVVRSLPATVVVGEDDARVLRHLGGRRTVHVIPNGVAPPDAGGVGEAAVPTVAFTGVLDYPPNVDAACYFARAVWPGIRAAVPAARLVIAGRRPVPSVLALAAQAGIEVRADVPDMYRVLQEAWVAVAPMRCGSGVKTKVLEAWAAARPVVMTSLARNGLALSLEAVALVADDVRAIGELVIGLLKDPDRRCRLGSALREHVLRQHRWADSAAHFTALLRGAAASSGALRERTPRSQVGAARGERVSICEPTRREAVRPAKAR